MARTVISSALSGTRHCIKFRLLLGSEQSADLGLRAVHKLPYLGVSIFAHDRLALRLCVLEHRQNLVELFLRQLEHLLQVLRPLGRVVLPAVGTGLRTLLSASCDRGWRWRRGLRGFIGRAEDGPGGDGKTGRNDCDSKRWFHALFLWISDRLRFRRWTRLPGKTPPVSHGYSFVRPDETERCGIYFSRGIPHRRAT